MELSFKSLAAGRTAGIKEVQQEVLGISKEESDALMDGLLGEATEAPEDSTSVKVKKVKKKAKTKTIKLKPVATDIPETES